ncbi:MAG TPA: cystathionine beta-lyase [Candidatus Baltobacteraceae bacterium]|nr:cystathionine beta-lyase [Candidatus Baltobacteraceae bacterium]
MPDSSDFLIDTKLAHLGRPAIHGRGVINMPPQRGSTVLFDSLAELDRATARKNMPSELYYGAVGTQTTHAFEEAMAELEGGYAGVAVGTGLAACAIAIHAFVRQGDHVLVTDSVYDPTRNFCDTILAAMGVETTYFNPTIGEGIAELIRPNTRVVYLESPGTYTFEVQDVPAICRIAHEHGAIVALDNTWATPLYFRALEHGVDVAVYAATKYVVGHSDVLAGVLVTTEAAYLPVRNLTYTLGHCLSPDDAYLCLRGLRTMKLRLEHQQRSALTIAQWLQAQPDVLRVLYPALSDDPGHVLWKRDFHGAASLFAFLLPASPHLALAALIDDMELFGLGYSWGGFTSLIEPVALSKLSKKRAAAPWDAAQGSLIRLHIGLEDVADLQRDLAAGLDRWRRAVAR